MPVKALLQRWLLKNWGDAYIDTGAMYRAVTYKFLQMHIPFDEEIVGKVADEIDITFKPKDGLNMVFVDGTDVTEEIRTSEAQIMYQEYQRFLLCAPLW